MTTTIDEITEETIKEIEECAARPMCECPHAGLDGFSDLDSLDVGCEAAAEFEVTVLCPDDRCTRIYLLCDACRDEWTCRVPLGHGLRVRPLVLGEEW